jgi:hypothetical protein
MDTTQVDKIQDFLTVFKKSIENSLPVPTIKPTKEEFKTNKMDALDRSPFIADLPPIVGTLEDFFIDCFVTKSEDREIHANFIRVGGPDILTDWKTLINTMKNYNFADTSFTRKDNMINLLKQIRYFQIRLSGYFNKIYNENHFFAKTSTISLAIDEKIKNDFNFKDDDSILFKKLLDNLDFTKPELFHGNFKNFVYYFYYYFLYDPFNKPKDFDTKPLVERVKFIQTEYHGRRKKTLLIVEYIKEHFKKNPSEEKPTKQEDIEAFLKTKIIPEFIKDKSNKIYADYQNNPVAGAAAVPAAPGLPPRKPFEDEYYKDLIPKLIENYDLFPGAKTKPTTGGGSRLKTRKSTKYFNKTRKH